MQAQGLHCSRCLDVACYWFSWLVMLSQSYEWPLLVLVLLHRVRCGVA
jgi:hypothetical protein